MKEKLFKFTISKPQYGHLVAHELGTIRQVLGDFEVVKVKYHWWLSTTMHIWCKKVSKKDKKMKFIIEQEHFKAETDDIRISKSLLNWLNSPLDTESKVMEPKALLSAAEVKEIPADTYLTITADDITIGGKSTPEYNGNKIWCRDDCMECVREANDLFKKEHKAELLELHVVQANNMFDNPIPDANGNFVWMRCVFKVNGERKVSRWVFRHAHSSVDGCRSYCAYYCGSSVRYNSAFRGGVFGSLAD